MVKLYCEIIVFFQYIILETVGHMNVILSKKKLIVPKMDFSRLLFIYFNILGHYNSHIFLLVIFKILLYVRKKLLFFFPF